MINPTEQILRQSPNSKGFTFASKGVIKRSASLEKLQEDKIVRSSLEALDKRVESFREILQKGKSIKGKDFLLPEILKTPSEMPSTSSGSPFVRPVTPVASQVLPEKSDYSPQVDPSSTLDLAAKASANKLTQMLKKMPK